MKKKVKSKEIKPTLTRISFINNNNMSYKSDFKNGIPVS